MSERLPGVGILAIAFSLLALGAVACGSGPAKSADEPEQTAPPDAAAEAAPDATPAPTGPGVALTIDHPDAEVFVDGNRIGLASDLESTSGFISLEAGLHQIAVRKPGFNTWRAEVSVREHTEAIQVSLVPATEQ